MSAFASVTDSDWSAVKYGSVKSTVCLRSALIVTADATMSHLPAASAVKIVSNAAVWKSTSRPPMRFAISSTRSMSNPTALPPSIDSNGGNAVSEPTVSTPSFSVLNALPVAFAGGVRALRDHALRRSWPRPASGAAVPSSFGDSVPHAAATRATHASSTSSVRDLI